MRIILSFIVTLLMLLTTEAFALRLLSYPNAQPPECNESYENALKPKTVDQVFSALRELCVERGGYRVLQQAIASGNSTEPTDITLTCIGEHPDDFTIFTCSYPSRNGNR